MNRMVERTPVFVAEKLFKAAFKRKTRQGKINVLIDAGFEDNAMADEALHFLNEAVIHGHVRQHFRNTVKYKGIERIIAQLSKK